jgi:hypothetical protein
MRALRTHLGDDEEFARRVDSGMRIGAYHFERDL